MTTLNLDVRTHRGHCPATLIQAAGEIDMNSVARLRLAVMGAVGRGSVVLDLTKVTFCDSSGVHLIYEADGAARAEDVAFRLCVSPEVRQVLDLVGGAAVLKIVPRVDSAFQS
jgi:anti-sigma B factor antagonist